MHTYKRAKCTHILWVFLGISMFAACCEAANQSARLGKIIRVESAKTICLDRYVLDIPATPNIGASSVKLDDGYGVPGVHSNGTSVPKWGEIEVVETHPSASTDIQVLRAQVGDLYKSMHSGLSQRELDAKIEATRSRIEGIVPDGGFSLRNVLEDDLLDLQWEKLTPKLRAEHTEFANEYAYRTATLFRVAYYDPSDRRIRMFKGRPPRPDSGTAKEELDRIRTLYQSRAPTNIPTAPGFCTGFGIIQEPNGPEQWTDFETPFRSDAYPNLIFNLSIKPSRDNNKRGAPSSHGVLPYFANKAGLRVKKFHGPFEVTLAGSPARLFGMQYDSRCKEQPCMPLENAYELVVETYGEPGRPESPHITLKMVAALYDGHKAKLDYGPGREWMKKVYKPGLRGSSPPPFEIGLAVFESVLTSFRSRPGAIATKAPTAGTDAPD